MIKVLTFPFTFVFLAVTAHHGYNWKYEGPEQLNVWKKGYLQVHSTSYGENKNKQQVQTNYNLWSLDKFFF